MRPRSRLSTSASLIASSSASLVPRADREMRGVRGVAEQDDVAARPALALDAAEVEPGRRADEVRGVRLQPMAVEIFGEQLLARGDACAWSIVSKPKLAPGLFRTFDDEGRAVGREAVGVRPDPAVLGLLEREGEGVEHLADVPSQTNLFARTSTSTPNASGLGVAEARVGAVRGDDEVVVAPLRIGGIAFGFEVSGRRRARARGPAGFRAGACGRCR